MGELLLYWNGDFEQLREFVNKNAELRNDVWSSPGGDKKTYSDGHTLISWRKGKKLLQIEGKEDNLIKAKLCSAICNVNFVSSGKGTRAIVSGQKDASPTLSTEADNSNLDAAIVGESSRPSIGLNAGNVEACLSEMGEVSVAVGERPYNCRKEMNLVNSPLVDQSTLSYEYLMHKTSCETDTLVSNAPKTPIITNSNYTEKACQTTVDEFNYSLNSQKTYVHHCICQQGYTTIEDIKSKISDLQSSVDSFETSLGDLDSILFSYNKAADLNEKYLAEITEYKNHISCLKQQLTTVKEERDSLQLATSLVVKEPKRCNSNNPVPNQNTILINERQNAFMDNKNSCQINNNPVRSKRFRNTFEPLINEANHVDSEPHEPQIEIIKLDDSCDGSKPVNSGQTINKHITKPPKNEVACPFFKEKRFLLERSDFLHPLNSQLSAQERRVPSFVPTHPFVPQHNVRQDTSFPFLSPNPLICPPYPPPPFQPFIY